MSMTTQAFIEELVVRRMVPSRKKTGRGRKAKLNPKLGGGTNNDCRGQPQQLTPSASQQQESGREQRMAVEQRRQICNEGSEVQTNLNEH